MTRLTSESNRPMRASGDCPTASPTRCLNFTLRQFTGPG
jgi:hypothetical protein